MSWEDAIPVEERKIFAHYELAPDIKDIVVRHCHCKIHTLTFPAISDSGFDPIVLIHGFGTGAAYWAPNIPQLRQNHTVHCFDMPGFGLSSRPSFSHDATLAELEVVSTFEDWRKEMAIDSMFLVSHSFAAFFSASYALEYPSRIAHLFLVDPWGFPEKPLLTQKQIDPQLYIHAISTIFSYFNPLFLVRLLGPYASRVIRMLRPDIGRKFVKEGEARNGDIYRYLAACNQGPPTGEALYRDITNESGFAKRPMSLRFGALDEGVGCTFIYGGKSFVDTGPAIDMQFRLPNAHVYLLRGAGHLVNVDVVNDFNEIIIRTCSRSA